jgi:transposase
MRGVYSQVLQDVLQRVDKTHKAFFRRGHGFPRFKGKGWFDSFTYPQLGFRVSGSQLSLSKILSREIVNHYGFIAVEDLKLKGLARGRLAESVRDAAWSSFIAKLVYKAESPIGSW